MDRDEHSASLEYKYHPDPSALSVCAVQPRGTFREKWSSCQHQLVIDEGHSKHIQYVLYSVTTLAQLPSPMHLHTAAGKSIPVFPVPEITVVSEWWTCWSGLSALPSATCLSCFMQRQFCILLSTFITTSVYHITILETQFQPQEKPRQMYFYHS